MGVGRIQRQHPETSPAGKKFCTAARACEWSRGGRWCGRAPHVPWKFRQGKDSALRCGQLGSVEPGPVLPPALQDTGGCLEGNCGSTSDLPAPDSQVLPVLLLLLAKAQGQVLLGLCAGMNPQCTKAGWAQGAIYWLSHLSAFPGVGPEPSPDPCKWNQKSTCCVHSFLSFKVLSLL